MKKVRGGLGVRPGTSCPKTEECLSQMILIVDGGDVGCLHAAEKKNQDTHPRAHRDGDRKGLTLGEGRERELETGMQDQRRRESRGPWRKWCGEGLRWTRNEDERLEKRDGDTAMATAAAAVGKSNCLARHAAANG